jgi:hypothetical protein
MAFMPDFRPLALILAVPTVPVLFGLEACSTPGDPTESTSQSQVAGGGSESTGGPRVARPPRPRGVAGGIADGGVDATLAPGTRTRPPVGPDAALGGTWQALTPPSATIAAASPFLLTDGTVMVHDINAAQTWWRLKPDIHGSYAAGTWSLAAPLPPDYAPLYFGGAVLPDGTLIVIGGEYNRSTQLETPLGAIYDPVADAWTPVIAPTSWHFVGDAPSVVLANGTFMLGSSETGNQALYDPRTQTWSLTGTGKLTINAEESWTLLPSGEVLDVDVVGSVAGPPPFPATTNSELYNPATGAWSSAGSTIVQLGDNNAYEIGPAVLMPTGNVFATGATPHTALYLADGGWQAGPDFPVEPDAGQLDIADGPAVLLPNGDVLCVTSPGDYQPPAFYLEFDGTNLNPVAGPPNAPFQPSFVVNLLLLPSGEVLETDFSPDIEVYAPNGSPSPAWAPTITSVPSTLTRGQTYVFTGTQFNGLSQAVSYGDDYQAATNYPLVRITNNATGHVFYARTHDHSTMGVATGNLAVTTDVDIPSGIETGASTVSVVANGIASTPAAVTIQ